jgi:DNA polymerase elongation subunit (family B)
MTTTVFQSIAWEAVDVTMTRTQFVKKVVPYAVNDIVESVLYKPEFMIPGVDRMKLRGSIGAMAVRVAGRTIDGHAVQHDIVGFRPYFYVRLAMPARTREELIHVIAGHDVFNRDTRRVDTIRPAYAFRDCEIALVQKIPFVGYHTHTEAYLRITCPSVATFRSTKAFLKRAHLPAEDTAAFVTEPLMLHESMCDPLVQFWIAYKIHPMTWISIDGETSTHVPLSVREVAFMPDHQDVAPFKVVHYDLECFSSVAYETGKNQMPNPTIPSDVIIGIGAFVTTSNGPTSTDEKHYFAVGPVHEDDDSFQGVHVHVYNNEREALVGFCDWLGTCNPDIWNAFNNFGFDDAYLFKRLELHRATHLFPCRDSSTSVRLLSKNFMSSAFQFEAKYLHHPLRVYTDLLLFARREWRSQMVKFSLENVAQVLLGKGKHDVSPQDIFKAWATQDPQGLTRVGAYCVQDCALVAEIMDARKVYSSILSRAELFLCDPRDLMLKGQQQIVFNLIFNQVRTETNFCIPDSADDAVEYEATHTGDAAVAPKSMLDVLLDDNGDSDNDSEEESDDEHVHVEKKTRTTVVQTIINPKKMKFKGATVLEPKRGAYMCPISGLDFASLYPSIMVAYNLCHSTKMLSDEHDHPDVPRESLYTTVLSAGRQTTFVQSNHRRGVLPQILLNLWAMRKQLKKLMAKADDEGNELLEAVYNAKQLAVKVAMNSIYGFCGADNGKLPMKDIAETVTANGRMLIDRTKNYVEEWYPCEVVYGDTDSVYVRFYLDELPERLRNPPSDEERTELMRWVFQRSTEAADRITAQFQKPIELEFEKVFYPLLLFKKKRYTGIIFEKPEVPKKMDFKGLSITRRDFAPFVKRVYGTVLATILQRRDIDNAFRYAEDEIMKLVTGQFGVQELVVSRSISKKPDEYANQNAPHLVVAKRNATRTGVDIRVGDRVEFVFRKGVGKQYELADDPSMVAPNDADGTYYYDHQIRSSLAEVFGLIDPARWSAFDKRIQNMISVELRGFKNKANGQKEITSFFASTRK